MTAVVGSHMGPYGNVKNCDTWENYEHPGESRSANLCNGGSYEGHLWQACPSRLKCRLATHKRAKGGDYPGQGIQIAASNRRPSFGRRTTLPTLREPTTLREAPPPPPSRVVYPEEANHYLASPRLEGVGHYRPSPTFVPTPGEGLVQRFIKNAFQAVFHAVAHQGKEISENIDFWPHLSEEDDDE